MLGEVCNGTMAVGWRYGEAGAEVAVAPSKARAQRL
jgi:hypothetical protein